MKQKDFLLIIVMVFLGAAAALIVSRLVFSSPKSRNQTTEVVDLISPEFPEPPSKYFNQRSINPAYHTNNSAEAGGG